MMSVISRVSALVPISDFVAAKEWAERLLFLQLILCTLGALSWAFGGVVQVSFGFALFALVGFEIGSMKLLKIYSVSLLGMWFIDIIWLSLWATRINLGKDLVFYPTLTHAKEGTQPRDNKYASVPRLLLAMECLLFIMRLAQILLWCKLWELDFCEVGIPAYTSIGVAASAHAGEGACGAIVVVPTEPSARQDSQFTGGGTHHGAGGDGERHRYRPLRWSRPSHAPSSASTRTPDAYAYLTPEEPGMQQEQQQQLGDVYVPPIYPPWPLSNTQPNEYVQDVAFNRWRPSCFPPSALISFAPHAKPPRL